MAVISCRQCKQGGVVALELPRWRTRPSRSIRYLRVSSVVWKAAWATVSMSSSTAMSSVSFGPRSSSQGFWLPSLAPASPPAACACAGTGAAGSVVERRLARVYHEYRDERLGTATRRGRKAGLQLGGVWIHHLPPCGSGQRRPGDRRRNHAGNSAGERLHLRGRWINHPIHGYQFRADSYSSSCPPAPMPCAATWPQAW